MQNFEKYISKTQNLKSLNIKNKSLKKWTARFHITQ